MKKRVPVSSYDKVQNGKQIHVDSYVSTRNVKPKLVEEGASYRVYNIPRGFGNKLPTYYDLEKTNKARILQELYGVKPSKISTADNNFHGLPVFGFSNFIDSEGNYDYKEKVVVANKEEIKQAMMQEMKIAKNSMNMQLYFKLSKAIAENSYERIFPEIAKVNEDMYLLRLKNFKW